MTGWEALRTLNLIRGLTHVVQVGTPRNNGMAAGALHWESIAGFCAECTAIAYAEQYTKVTTQQCRVKPLEGWET